MALTARQAGLLGGNLAPAPTLRAVTINGNVGSTSATRTLSADASRVVGDELLLWILEGSAVTVGSPGGGWTLAHTDDAPGGTLWSRDRLYRRTCDGTSADDASWTVSGATARRVGALYVLNSKLRTATAGALDSISTSTNPDTSQTPGNVTAPTAGHAVLLRVGYGNGDPALGNDAPSFDGDTANGLPAAPAGWTSNQGAARSNNDGTASNGITRAGMMTKRIYGGVVTAPTLTWKFFIGESSASYTDQLVALTP